MSASTGHEHTVSQTDRQKGHTDRHDVGQTEGQTDRQKQTNRQAHMQAVEQAGKWTTDRQLHSYTHLTN